MIVGTPERFAIESSILFAYQSPGSRALGFFVLHIGGKVFGVRQPDATMLAVSFDEVGRRLRRRGQHISPIAEEVDAAALADNVRSALYDPDQQDQMFYGQAWTAFEEGIQSSHVLWAPDGDEAFDDRSYVLQFDVASRVRLIAFRADAGYRHDPETLEDVWLEGDEFYSILQDWYDAFATEWAATPKTAVP